MKYLPLIISLAFLPLVSFAHTSDERYVDGYVVDLSTAPVAPWVGEKVGMSFVFLEPTTFRATSTVLSASLSIDALMRTNNKRQEVIYESAPFPVTDGGFVTSYIFTEEGTYDMHLTFTDTRGNVHVAGFRKQVRSGNAETGTGMSAGIFFGTILLITGLSFLAGRLSRKDQPLCG